VAIEYGFAQNQLERLPALAADIVRKRVAVIVVSGGPSVVFAAKAATTAIPIVFLIGDDPVKLGLVTSLARPGGNLTGINFFAAELAAKRLELLRELVPSATRVGVLVNPANAANTEATLRDVEGAARAMGLQIRIINASTNREIDAAFASFEHERPDALFVGSGPLFSSRRVQLALLETVRRSRDICQPTNCRSWRADELWGEPDRCSPSDWCLCRPRPQGGEARGNAGRTVDEVRTRNQCADCPDARPGSAIVAARPRRRGD
jgi:hypothetical protein